MNQFDNDLCDYSYYIDNEYQCVITGEKCVFKDQPDSRMCGKIRDPFLKAKGDRNSNECNGQQ